MSSVITGNAITPIESKFHYQPVLVTGSSNVLSAVNLKSQRSQPEITAISPKGKVTNYDTMINTPSYNYMSSESLVKVIMPSAYIAQKKEEANMGIRQTSIPESVKLQQPLVFAEHDIESQTKPFSATTKVPRTERIMLNPNGEKFSQLTFSDRYIN